jgi:hypothetical protein
MARLPDATDGVKPSAPDAIDFELLTEQRITIEMLRLLESSDLSALKAELKAQEREIVRQIQENKFLPRDERRDMDWERAARQAARHRERALGLISAVNRERGERQRIEADERRAQNRTSDQWRGTPVGECITGLGRGIHVLRAAEALHVAAVAFIDDDSDEMFEALEQATQAFSIAVGGAS